MKPFVWFVLGMPFGAFLMWLWVQGLLSRALAALEDATQTYARAEQTFRRVRDLMHANDMTRRDVPR
jgi:hypothetical protein